MGNVPELFGSMVFSDEVMKSQLPKDVYKALKKTIIQGTHLELDVANAVAVVIKNWAIDKGATHFSHWFQPLTNITAEKHESFISPTDDGKIIMNFSGKELIKGEPDASSFPSGGLRTTSEARGYTVWDITSNCFVRDKTLYIPAAFCSYNGEALDNKIPLLRSMEAIDKQALRVLRLFGNNSVGHVNTTVGPEQEYFLIDKKTYSKRPDLIFTGRTLFGALPPKGQELDDHYFGSLKPEVSAFMNELDEELWKLGIHAKTKHNEVSPAQHELAPIFTTTNIAVDHNLITMNLMKNIANRHGLVCLLHEKPFAGLNGSGKHNNWSVATDTGINLLEPGEAPFDNMQFLLFLAAVIKAVDEYQDLLRISVASAGNDHRLGANEAPPAIVSIFLGTELTAIVEAVESGKNYSSVKKEQMELGVMSLPHFIKDTTDRNRTSPFAFTGNKFEFRMLGSMFSIAGSNIILNTIVAESLREFADTLEKSENFKSDLTSLIRKTFRDHKRIIFNGNGYSKEWEDEAKRRGLSNIKTTVDALPEFISPKSIKLFAKHRVFTESEIHSRYEILLECYSKTINIEALTMIDMIKKVIIPACISYQNELAQLVGAKKVFNQFDASLETHLLEHTSKLSAELLKKLKTLENEILNTKGIQKSLILAKFYRERVFSTMSELRLILDQLETLVAKKHWPLPTYADLLYSVE